jgi:hypothetical protein
MSDYLKKPHSHIDRDASYKRATCRLNCFPERKQMMATNRLPGMSQTITKNPLTEHCQVQALKHWTLSKQEISTNQTFRSD